jgi:hypothetical protein
MFVAFDVYYLHKDDVRHLPFMRVPLDNSTLFKDGTRLEFLNNIITEIEPSSVVQHVNTLPITIGVKKFTPVYTTQLEKNDNARYDIFKACRDVMIGIHDKLYPYHTDGLIFTPTILGVGSNKILHAGPKRLTRWEYAFKWKPPESNTIDFLVFTKKSTEGRDIVSPLFEPGQDLTLPRQLGRFKTLELAVGFDVNKHGYLNPCQDVIDDKFDKTANDEGSKRNDNYKPKRFYPSEPYDIDAGTCNIILQLDADGNFAMLTEEHQIMENNMIVEFKYDSTREPGWRWIPLRVRYDKTSDYKNGMKSFGNDYTTANNNWFAIHNPVTEEMITTGQNIPMTELSDNVYYNTTTEDRDWETNYC